MLIKEFKNKSTEDSKTMDYEKYMTSKTPKHMKHDLTVSTESWSTRQSFNHWTKVSSGGSLITTEGVSGDKDSELELDELWGKGPLTICLQKQ